MKPELFLPERDLDPNHAAFARAIRAFAQRELEPHARRIDEEGVFRREMVTAMGREGIVGGPISQGLGGRGWSALEVVVAHEEIGAVCGNARGFLAVQTGLVAQCIEKFGDRDQQQRFVPKLASGELIGCFGLTEDGAGSDVAALQCRARSVEGGYEITGEKIWITNGPAAELGIVFATLDPERGKDGITAFLVDMTQPGVRKEPMPGKELGHRGSGHARLVFTNAKVGHEAVLGGTGNGFLVAMGGLHCGRISVAAGAVGLLRAALTASLAFAESRKQFGKPIAAFQMVQERLADMVVDLHASRALVHRCARMRDAGTEHTIDLALAKLHATEAAGRAAEQAVLLHGGRGYSSAYPVERLLRDSFGLRIYEGTSLIQKSIIARAVG